MTKEAWVVQEEAKYRDHDMVVDDIGPKDLGNIKGIAIANFVNTPEADATKLTIGAFMGYLTTKGFRITKENK